MNKYQYTTQDIYTPQPAQPAGRAYLHTPQAGAWLPFLQATITGLMIGFLTVGLLFVLDARHPWTPGLFVGLLSWAATWLLLQKHWFNLTALERSTGLDINQDGRIGGRPAAPAEIRVRLQEVKPDGHYQETIARLPCTSSKPRPWPAGC
jgi:hypothetical protein